MPFSVPAAVFMLPIAGVFLALVSCQLNAPIKETPIVGQVAVGVNKAVSKEEFNETASLFAPRDFRKQSYTLQSLSQPILNNQGVEIGMTESKPIDRIFPEALVHVRSASPAEQTAFLHQCIAKIDANYFEWLEDYIRGRAAVNTSLDILAQGLSAAGAMFTPASTVRILSGTSTFVQGANSTIEQKYFLSLTAIQQVPMMTDERREAREQLDQHMSGTVEFEAAISDLESYYMAGTLFSTFATPPKANRAER